jgi:hypothetical protein
LICIAHSRDEDFLERIKDRVELELRDLVGNHHTQLIAIERPVLVGLAVHPVDDRKLGFERLLYRRLLCCNQVGETLYGRIWTERCEVALHHRARFVPRRRYRRCELRIFGEIEAHDGGTERLHFCNDAFHDLVDLLVSFVLSHEVGHDADACAFERVGAQEVRIGLGYAPVTECGDRIRGVVAGHHIEQ